MKFRDCKDEEQFAFPMAAVATEYGGGVLYEPHFGMTLRDYFAATALGGYISGDSSIVIPPEDAAAQAYRYADAMLTAREAGKQ